MNIILGLLLAAAIEFQLSAGHLYPKSGDVIDLEPDTFDKVVLQSDSIWIVEFYAPWCGHCKQLVPEYQKAAKAMKGIVKVGAVNVDTHRSLGEQYNVKGFPTIKIFGANKKSPLDYNGQRTAQAFVEAALQEAKKKIQQTLGAPEGSQGDTEDVIELTDSNFNKLVLGSDDLWMVEFYAPWCGHCKNLAPHWAKAAGELKGKVKFGALDATVHSSTAQAYGVQGYPTIKFFPRGKKVSSDAVDYDGGRTSSDIVTWALEKFSESIPAPEVKELVNLSVFKEQCEDKPLCVFASLPDILDCDSKCRNAYLDILKEMAEKYKKKQWGWIWSSGATQAALENALEIGGFGYPAMAAANFRKMKYSTLRGSFSKEGINEFLRDISFGRGRTAPITSIPKIQDIEPWDGKDGQLPEEEDFDLSDIDLDETEDQKSTAKSSENEVGKEEL